MSNGDVAGRKKTQFVCDLRNGTIVNDSFAVARKTAPKRFRDKPGYHFDLLLSDKTGAIDLKFWGREDSPTDTLDIFESIPEGGVVLVSQGRMGEYKDRPQITVTQGEGKIVTCSDFDPSDYIASLKEDHIEFLFSRLRDEISRVQDEQLRKLLETMFEDPEFVLFYKKCPSAMTRHHNCVGGNLQHTINVIDLCGVMCKNYPEVRKDLIMCGAILHDVGKIRHYRCGATISLTREGERVGHLVLGDRLARKAIEKLRADKREFANELEDELSHLILSHHWKPEWGTQAKPRTVEAYILHYADLMDSSVKGFLQHSLQSPTIA